MIASPEKQMVPPAIAWVYFSSLPILANPIPQVPNSTMLNIVAKVVIAKTPVTMNMPPTLLFAAGYIRRGMSGSHGPSTKTVNNIHGVRSLTLAL